jgi:hypothetical protein
MAFLLIGGGVNQTLAETSCKSDLFKKVFFGMPPICPVLVILVRLHRLLYA